MLAPSSPRKSFSAIPQSDPWDLSKPSVHIYRIEVYPLIFNKLPMPTHAQNHLFLNRSSFEEVVPSVALPVFKSKFVQHGSSFNILTNRA